MGNRLSLVIKPTDTVIRIFAGSEYFRCNINMCWPPVRQKGLGMVHFLLQSAAEATAEATTEQVVEAVVNAHNEALFGQALQITLIGMVILFVSLLILWGVMELLVRLVKDDPKKKKAEEAEVVETADAGDDDEKLKAAAAAAAYVIAKK
ncbi:MAG: OadG family protein [Anaerolineaceae bacterium]|nr:OadG family protein [Anaerolineaceae bacterium]